MTSADLLADAFDRIRGVVGRALDGMTDEQLAEQVGPVANSISWLVWHLTRIQDDHVCDVAGIEQAWIAQGWYERFGLPFAVTDHGYGHTEQQVEQVRVPGELLRAYHDAVYARTVEYVKTIRDADLDRVVDTSWDPPVTLGVRLVSVISDDLQHAGQAAYVKGLLLNR
ncbi:MAG TPA: DUF664 domain-containing protein [Mycobacteriales bacterium]